MLLAQERARRQELEQEIVRLRAGLARQNEAIIALERENAELRREVADLRLLVAGLTEQNALLRQQVAMLQQENARLRGDVPRAPYQPDPFPRERPIIEPEQKPRKKRDKQHNRGRQRTAQADEEIEHVPERCPRCGGTLAGGWEHRRVQVIDLPAVSRAVVTDHVLIARHCCSCRRRVVASPASIGASRVGQCRFGPRLLAVVATMATVERLPGRQIQARLAREYGLRLSHGGIVELLHLVARRAAPAYHQVQERIRGSPVVHGDETGWRQSGVPGYIWIFSSPDACYFHYDPSRSGQVADAVLGDSFGGVLVTDFYAAYDHLPGLKQRCWVHLWRDITALAAEHPDDTELCAWIAGVRAIYETAMAERPAAEEGMTPQAVRARHERAKRYEQQLLLLCPEEMASDRPEVTLAKRIRRYQQELFTFVRELDVPATNNAAERNLRPLVIARKISGGTRSAAGSQTRMVLATVLATARLNGQDPSAACNQFLLAGG
jgi:DNA-directed RNA polymerase subunit N (RpoN/RPB10)